MSISISMSIRISNTFSTSNISYDTNIQIHVYEYARQRWNAPQDRSSRRILLVRIILSACYTRPYLVCERRIRAKRQELRHCVLQALVTCHVQRRSLVVAMLSRDTHTHTSVPCAHPTPLLAPPLPPYPLLSDLTPLSLSLRGAATAPAPAPCLRPQSTHAPTTPRALPAGPARPRAWLPPSAPPPPPRACSRMPATGPFCRSARVCVQMRRILHACVWGGRRTATVQRAREGARRECIHSSVPGIQ